MRSLYRRISISIILGPQRSPPVLPSLFSILFRHPRSLPGESDVSPSATQFMNFGCSLTYSGSVSCTEETLCKQMSFSSSIARRAALIFCSRSPRFEPNPRYTLTRHSADCFSNPFHCFLQFLFVYCQTHTYEPFSKSAESHSGSTNHTLFLKKI